MVGWLTQYLRAGMEYMNVQMGAALHNWCILMLLFLTEFTAVALLARFLATGLDIPEGVLTLFQYELMGLLAGIGVVGGFHTVKAVKGVESGSRPAAPIAPEPKPDS